MTRIEKIMAENEKRDREALERARAIEARMLAEGKISKRILTK